LLSRPVAPGAGQPCLLELLHELGGKERDLSSYESEDRRIARVRTVGDGLREEGELTSNLGERVGLSDRNLPEDKHRRSGRPVSWASHEVKK